MPQFILNSPRRAHPFYALSNFAKGYVEAMFFTNCDSGDERENLANELGVERLTRKSVAFIASDCDAFLSQLMPDNRPLSAWLSALDGYSMEQAGRDFWFTRQGHGVGFWDREELVLDIWANDSDPAAPWEPLPDEMHNGDGFTFVGALRDILSERAKDAGEVYPEIYRGWIYHP